MATKSPNPLNRKDLNVSQDTWDELVNTPDMQALNDRGDAIARDLEATEKNQTLPEGIEEGLEKAEQNTPDSSNTENIFNFENTKTKTSAPVNNSNRRRLAIGGGVGASATALILLLFSLLPLKIPGILQAIANEAGQRVEQVTEKRAKLIIGRAILTKFGTHSGVVLTGNGAFSTLVASMRTSGFEKRLADKGIKITATRDGVKLHRVDGTALGGGKELKNERAIIAALDADKVTNKIIKDIVREDIPSWRWMKRAKFAHFLRIKYGIPRYGLKTDNTEKDEEKRAADAQKERLKTGYSRVAVNASNALDCIMGDDCVAQNLNGEDKGDLKSSENADDVKAAIQASGEEIAEASSKDPSKLLTTKLTETLLGKIGAKAIPIIGWIDLAATLDHIAYEALDNDYFAKIPSYFRGLQYAQMYGEWEGYSDQQKLGALDPAVMSSLTTQLDGAEKSRAFNYINGDASKGEAIKLKVDSNNPSAVKKYWEDYKNSLGNIPGAPGNKPSHFVLNAFYETIGGGGLIGWLSGGIGDLIAGFTPDAFTNWIGKYLEKGLGKMLDFFGITIDPLDAGPALMNDLHAGATVSYNDYCQNELGCRKLSAQQASIQNATIAAERTSDLADKSVAYKLFSPDNTRSLATQLAITTPVPNAENIGSFVTELAASIPSRIASMVIPKTSATTGYVDLYGVDPYGATADDLDEPLSEAFVDGETCPEVDNNEFDNCKADTEVAEAMLCEFQPESSECTGEETTAVSSGGTGLTVASYNVLEADDHSEKSNLVGGCNQNPVPGDPTCAKTRTERQIQIITGNSDVGNPAFDIFGTQEMGARQYNLLKDGLPDYDAFPENDSGLSNKKDGKVGVFWNKTKLMKVDSGKAPGRSNVAADINNPWVALQTMDATGQPVGPRIYVMSIHYSNSSFTGPYSDSGNMLASSNLTMDWVRSVATGDNVVIVMGDFNDQLSQKLSYCVYTKNGIMQHVHDLQQNDNPSAGCDKPDTGGIDHMYVTPKVGVSAKGWEHMANTGIVARASDHTPVYATVNVGGTSDSVGSIGDVVGGWAWPLAKRWWTSDRADWLNPHGMSSGTFTSPYARGIASDIGTPPDGSPIYSMLAGKVIRADSCAIVVQTITTAGSLSIAYGHSVNHEVKEGDQVSAGQQLSAIGSTCNSTGGHLHVDMALDAKHICPQDIFLAMDKGTEPNLGTLVSKGVAPCGRL